MKNYIKIETPFARATDGTKKLIEGKWRSESVNYLAYNSWVFTEKVDGTNIGIEWDGHEVSYHGHTEKAQIPPFLMEKLIELFGSNETEEMFEQTFGEKHVIFYGEGYGGKIQKVGKLYREDVSFILFDIYMPDSDVWLDRADVVELAKAFGIEYVPYVHLGDIESAVAFVKTHPKSYLNSKAPMEGLVGRPLVEMKDKQGKRIIVKIKVKDFE